MASTVSLTFPDSIYTSSNKPSADTLKSDLSAIETALNANSASMVETTDSDVSSWSFILDEDAMGSNSNQKLPTQQSVKAYIDSGTVTMTNKTLTSPTINTPTIATPTVTGWTGWITSSDTWTYASATSFTIAGANRTSIFTKGTKIKLTNDSATKYYYVSGSTFDTDTTVNLRGETDLADSAITAPYYSYNDCPQGFKRGQDYFRAKAYLGTQQDNLVNETATQVTLDTEDYDTNGNFATNAYTAPITGFYQVSAQASFVNTVADKQYRIEVRLGEDAELVNEASPSLADRCMPSISDTVYLTKGDVVTLYATSESGGNTVDIDDGKTLTYLTIQFIGI